MTIASRLGEPNESEWESWDEYAEAAFEGKADKNKFYRELAREFGVDVKVVVLNYLTKDENEYDSVNWENLEQFVDKRRVDPTPYELNPPGRS